MTEAKPERDWAAYYEATRDRPPRRTLLEALRRSGDPGSGSLAVDLGCGDGRDTVELLRRGWSVLAIDAEPGAIERLEQRADLVGRDRLSTRCVRFEEACWPPADLVNASFSLPLCPPDRFPGLWRNIRDSLASGGRFAGQLYGERDGWAGRPGVTHCDRATAYRLLDGLVVEMFEEEESDAVTPRGKPKHWHIFHIVARRS
jgi:tellurite methyltransferase